MEQYELLKGQQSRVCNDHSNKLLSFGCDKCLKMICNECVCSTRFCDDGKTHQMVTLKQLVEHLNEEINKLKRKIIEKEEGLEQIFKFTSQKLAEYDKETFEMVQKIHDKRDEQIKTLESKYKQLEDEYTEDRLKTKTLITDFLENEILKKWSQIRNIMRKTESRVKHAHQCDIVSGYSDTKNDIQRLIDEVMPSIQVLSLSKVREKRSIPFCIFPVITVWLIGILS
ncbi:nuclear cap-binding protein subunit 1-like [Watersipora subatra]|uniref:nuclear cap-binding protein subunit 1-like n=1 Tax=Watersipora subatra TaxID=2589382 RepID=UPI00355BE8D9